MRGDQENPSRELIQLCGGAVFLRNQDWEKNFLFSTNFISTDGAQEMQKSSSQFSDVRWIYIEQKTYFGASLLDSRGRLSPRDFSGPGPGPGPLFS
jgi:hypothetical protein